ncbi:MAG: ABC transporter permease [Erysipelotrichaceae bacterium]|nr:ABC transporter permease [Erysipelotrichaceae bacterium]MBQ1534061.1 ABC transporter permease [Erysipelotrichaceae bacterium]MBQ1788220.1 ABC transporter permease [Erysipelotrichaceae bacterium]MBQ5805529.1 ABC transporter permease [Erysipelotrichaceae bacterium]MBQ6125619.1 ABC transporter permease [Erysipelotrichaceae bacterium]
MKKKEKYISTTQIEKRFGLIRTALAIVISLLFCFLLIFISSKQPFQDIVTFMIAPLTSPSRFCLMLLKMSPLLFTSVAVCVLFSANTANLAVETAFYAAALSSSVVSVIEGFAPAPLHFIAAAIAGCLGSIIVLLIPAVLELKFNANIVVSSLMLNYIINLLGNYLICGPLKEPGFSKEATRLIQESAKLPIIANVSGQKLHLGIIIGIVCCVVGWFIIYKTNFGYEARTVGQNPNFAKFSGINVGKVIVIGSLIAAIFCGIGATSEINGYYRRMEWEGSIGYGWDGIMIAILANNNPLFCIPGAAFLAYIRTSADILNMTSNIPIEIANVVQQVVIIMIAAKGLLSRPEKKAIIANAKKQAELKEKELAENNG